MSHRIQVCNADVNIRKALMKHDDYQPDEKQLVNWHVAHADIPKNGIFVDHEDYVEKPKFIDLNLEVVYYFVCCNWLRKNNALIRLEDTAKHGYIIRATIHDLQEELLINGYIRIHDSYIVNELFVNWVEYPHWLWLGNYKLPIGYFYLKKFKLRFTPVPTFNGNKPHRRAA